MRVDVLSKLITESRYCAQDVLATVEMPPEDVVPLWGPLAVQPGGTALVCPQTGRHMSPQQMAYESEADELFYGGAPGGGKTHLGIGLALTRHRNSVIFRTEYTEFTGEDGIAAKVDEVLEAAGYADGIGFERNMSARTWKRIGPSRRALQLAAVSSDKDLRKWKRPHDLKVFDELPEFKERHYRYLIGWLRTTHVGQRTRIVSTGNPPTTVEGRWVVRYWAPWLDPGHPRPAKPGELRWYASVGKEDVERPDGTPFEATVDGKVKRVVPLSRTFVPAQVQDNPHYDIRYRDAVLANMPEPWGTMLSTGDFGMSIPDSERQVIPRAWVQAAMRRWRPDGGTGRHLTRAGCDPSRGGGAEFVVATLHETWVAPLSVTPPRQGEIDGMAGAQIVARAVGGDQAVAVQVDMDGIGASVVDHAVGIGLNVQRINGALPSAWTDGAITCANLRSELHWRMRELLKPGRDVEVALPPDPQLEADLCAPRFEFVRGGVKVEPKEDIVARLGRSPDRGEAVIYACVRLQPKAKPQQGRMGILW